MDERHYFSFETLVSKDPLEWKLAVKIPFYGEKLLMLSLDGRTPLLRGSIYTEYLDKLKEGKIVIRMLEELGLILKSAHCAQQVSSGIPCPIAMVPWRKKFISSLDENNYFIFELKRETPLYYKQISLLVVEREHGKSLLDLQIFFSRCSF